MNELVYSFRDNNVRVVEIDNVVWFVAKDVCEVLELSDVSKTLSRLDDDEKGKSSIRTHGGTQEMLIVNESGLYSLILGSRKTEAKEFKRWVTHEVLPSIRKTGSYQQSMSREQLAAALTIEVSKELDVVKQDLADVKTQLNERMTIDYGEQLLLLRHKNKRVETLHCDSHAHVDRALMHRKAWSDFKRAFGVSSYRDTLVKDLPEAISYLKAWRPLV